MSFLDDLSGIFDGSKENSTLKTVTLKKIRLDSLDTSADENTKKTYEYLISLLKDKKYSNSNKKADLYVRTYNQLHEWPDFMQDWIKKEYVHLQALKAVNLSLNVHKNNYSGQLSRIVNDLDPGDAKKSIDSLLNKLDSNQIYVDESFFNNVRYAMRQSPLTPNVCSRLQLLLVEWTDTYVYLLTEKKKQIQLSV